MKGIKGSVLEQKACSVRHLYDAKSAESAWKHTTDDRRYWLILEFATTQETKKIRETLGEKFSSNHFDGTVYEWYQVHSYLELPEKLPGIFARLVKRALKPAPRHARA